jgi:hypothetical protein
MKPSGLILQTNPVDIARKDYLEFFIEEILDEGDKKRVSTFPFGEMVGLRRDIQLNPGKCKRYGQGT